MRSSIAAALLLSSCVAAARAADLPAPIGPMPVRTVLPRPDADAALCLPAPALELSRFTGQPLWVVYNDPGRAPGSVVPDVALVPLPRVHPFRTKAAYPRGY